MTDATPTYHCPVRGCRYSTETKRPKGTILLHLRNVHKGILAPGIFTSGGDDRASREYLKDCEVSAARWAKRVGKEVDMSFFDAGKERVGERQAGKTDGEIMGEEDSMSTGKPTPTSRLSNAKRQQLLRDSRKAHVKTGSEKIRRSKAGDEVDTGKDTNSTTHKTPTNGLSNAKRQQLLRAGIPSATSSATSSPALLPITSTRTFISRLTTSPATLTLENITILLRTKPNRSFRRNAHFGAFIRSLNPPTEFEDSTAFRCLILATIVDWIESPTTTCTLIEQLRRTIDLCKDFDAEEEEVEFLRHSTDNEPLYDVLYGFHVRSIIDADYRSFVDVDWSGIVWMLGTDAEREAVVGYAEKGMGDLRGKETKEDFEEFWVPVVKMAVEAWLGEFDGEESGEKTLFGRIGEAAKARVEGGEK